MKITIADNGSGIPESHIPRIFEPFFSTKETKGTGLGLWVSQGIVQKHGGKIQVRTSHGVTHHGTCFMIFLPFAIGEAVPEEPSAIQSASDGMLKEATAGNDLASGGIMALLLKFQAPIVAKPFSCKLLSREPIQPPAYFRANSCRVGFFPLPPLQSF